MEIKVGDKVMLRKNLRIGVWYGAVIFNCGYGGLRNKVLTVAEITGLGCVIVEGSDIVFSLQMFEKVQS